MTRNTPTWNDAMSMPTGKQLDGIHDLQRRLHLSNAALDSLCEDRFGCPFSRITRDQASTLIDEMKHWTEVPADLRREMGQQDLFEVSDL